MVLFIKVNKNIKNNFYISATILAISAFVLFVSVFNNKSAWLIWNNFHCERIASALEQNDPKLFFDIGNYYFGKGAYDLKKVESYYKKALFLEPSLEGLHYQLARVYFIKNELSLARYEINKELELHPDLKRSYYVRGLINGYDNNLDGAIEDFTEFLKWSPESWAGHNDLAWIYFKKGNYEKSLATSEEGLKYYAGSVWLLNSKGVALINLGRKEEAKIVLSQALLIAEGMSAEDWGKSYPGNNPDVYIDGLEAMKISIKRNLALAGN